MAPALSITGSVEDLVQELYRLGTVRRQLAGHALAELGSQGFNALADLVVHGPLRTSELAERLLVDLSVASRQVNALVRAGYVERAPDPHDRRASLLSATPDGERALRDSHRRMVDTIGRALAGWDDADVTALGQGLRRLREDFAASEGATS